MLKTLLSTLYTFDPHKHRIVWAALLSPKHLNSITELVSGGSGISSTSQEKNQVTLELSKVPLKTGK